MKIHDSLRSILDALPLHAEEGSLRETISEVDLLATLAVANGEEFGTAAIKTIRAIFEALALLDAKTLEDGRWAFVSFPASLVGRSILSTLATPGQTLVSTHYWEQGYHRPSSDVEEQRLLLNTLETRRQRFHPGKIAQPIRTVHVAWGVIKIGGRFLMVRRDDKVRYGSGDYVFPGGRLNSTDLPFDQTKPEVLRDLFKFDSPMAAAALHRTLVRELEEECGLQRDQFELGKPVLLPKFQKVEGARNQHALSQYNIAVYPILLTDEGELRLLDRESEYPDQFAWFTVNELLQGTRLDGKKAFVDALREIGLAASEAMLEEVPNSGVFTYPHSKDTDALDLPASTIGTFFQGKTGKEAAIDVSLSESEWGMLLLLGWHSKSLNIQPKPDALQLMDNGWIKLLTEEAVGVVEHLSQKLESGGLPVPMRRGVYCRLSVDPSRTFFDKELFTFQMPSGDRDQPFTLRLNDVQTIWGKLGAASVRIELPRNMVRVIRSIESTGNADSPNIKGEDLQRQIRGTFQAVQTIGLRKFIFVSKGAFKLAAAPSDEAIR